MVGQQETGNETYVKGIVGGLSSLGVPPSIICYHTSTPWDDDTHVTFRRVSPNPFLRLGIQLPQLAASDGLDMLTVTYIAPLWIRCPTAVAVHDISYLAHPEWFSRRDRYLLRTQVPRSIRQASAVLTLTESARRDIIDQYHIPEDKTHIVTCGPGPAAQSLSRAAAGSALREIGIKEGTRFLLFVGSLQPRKNLTRLLQAFRLATADSGPEVVLVVVGKAQFPGGAVSEAVKEVGGGRVILTGYLDDRRLAAAYATCEAFIIPSLHEGFGIPAVEAMWHGAPVLAAAASALPEVCGEAAIYFDPLNVNEMAATIGRILSDPELRGRLRHAGQERAKSFTWAHAARQLMRVARKIA